MPDDLDLVSKLPLEDQALARFRLSSISPDDGKYGEKSSDLELYLSPRAEWMACVAVQEVLLETRVEFGQAKKENLDELERAIPKLDPLNIALLEENVTHHDQIAVLEEIGRYVSPETKALLHPGTTSYDILDTARACLLRKAWNNVIRPTIRKTIESLCELGEQTIDVLQVGRTHLQNTSPVPLGATSDIYALRLAERTKKCDLYFDDLRGKISGIVGTGASISMVVGKENAEEFEKKVLEKFGLKPDTTATQVTQKERLADVGHGIVSLMHVLGDFANDMRMLYSSSIKEVTDRKSQERLGGSSADAGKNNPINWENIAGKVAVVESGMRVLYAMIQTDFQRDLRSSVQARYQPNQMLAETYESFLRANKALQTLSINQDKIEENLQPVRNNPSEAMTAILRGEQWLHPTYGGGHDFVKEMQKRAQKTGRRLLDVCLEDEHFREVHEKLSDEKVEILNGQLELYTGFSKKRAMENIAQARELIINN